VAAIAMRVNYIRRLVERQPQQATEELWKIEELARRTTKEIRHMLFTLRPLVLETQGLLAALAQLAEKMQETHDMHVMLKAQPDAEEYLDTNQQGVLFYIVEEAVNNARKHAQSETVWVRLFRREGFIVVEIEDNGIGFDVGAVDSSYDQRDSLGMVNMRERAELIEGTLRIQSAAGRGTKITVLVPVNRTGMVDDTDPIPPLELQSHRSRAQRPIQPLPRPKTGSLGPIKPITNPVEPEAAPPDSPAASAAPNNNSRHISRPRQAERPAILPKTTKPRRPLSPTNE
jgi:two-component sensor histidine kinase